MPKNHREPKPVEPEPDSSEDESETDDSSAEEEAPIPETQKPVPDDDDSETEGSESESGESDEEPPMKPKPIAIVPPPANPQKSAPANSQKPSAKKAEPSTPAKRQVEEKDEGKGGNKRNKKKKPDPEAKSKGAEDTPTKVKSSDSGAVSAGAGAESSKKLFQRIWSEDDEIVILQGMLDYEAEKKVSPRAGADFDAFLEFIKGKLHVDVNKTQVQDKVRRLKSKYDNNRGKDRNKFIPSLLKKPHELAVFQLSEKVWGNETLTPSAPAAAKAKSNGPAKANGTSDKKSMVDASSDKKAVVDAASDKKPTVDEDDSDPMCVDVVKPVAPAYGYGFTEEDKILRIGYELFGGRGNNKVEGAKEWRKLLKEDMELTMKKFDLKRAQMQLVLDHWED